MNAKECMQCKGMTEWSEICCLFVTVQCGDGSGDEIFFFVDNHLQEWMGWELK